MPVQYRVDRAGRMVFSRAWGTLTVEDLLQHQNELRADPLVQPGFNQIFDLRDVTHHEISASDVRRLALYSPFDATSRRAIVATTEREFGLARMGEMILGGRSGTIRVFRDYHEACRWLGIDADETRGPGA